MIESVDRALDALAQHNISVARQQKPTAPNAGVIEE
jgi:hypothetical protein